MEYILYFVATRVCPACCHEIQNIFYGTRGIHDSKITKTAGYAKEIDVVDELNEEIQRVLQEKDAQNTICKQPKKAWKILIKDWQGFLQPSFCYQVWCNLFSSFVLALFVGGRGLLASDALRLSTRILSHTRRSRVFYTFLEYSPNISQVHYHTINAQDEFFFYNITSITL